MLWRGGQLFSHHLGHRKGWRIQSTGKHKYHVALIDVRCIFCGWLSQHLASPYQNWQGPLEAGEVTTIMIPLRNWTFILPCKLSLPCNDTASQRKGFSCVVRFQLLRLYSRYPKAWLTVLCWSCIPMAGLRDRSPDPRGALAKAAVSLVLKWMYEHLTPSG